MAFLDDLSKKITDVTSNAAQKTRDMAEISKLNSSISEEETKLNNAYIQIGKLYCANHGSDYEDCFGSFIDVVTESEKKIADMNAQIREIKGIITCPTCGEYVSLSVAFCSSCGTPTPKPEPTEQATTVLCPMCGNGVPKEMRFCTSCGFRMPEAPKAETQTEFVEAQFEDVPVDEQPAVKADTEETIQPVVHQQDFTEDNQSVYDLNESSAPATEAVQQPQGKVCPNCGKFFADGLFFCTECGTRL